MEADMPLNNKTSQQINFAKYLKKITYFPSFFVVLEEWDKILFLLKVSDGVVV